MSLQKPNTNWNLVSLALLMTITISLHVTESGVSGNSCPTLYTEVREHTAIGDSIVQFETDAAGLELVPAQPIFEGFLRLEKNGSNTYQIILNKHIDLLLLNPNREAPNPVTNEDVQCGNASDSGNQASNFQLDFIKAIEYTLKCSIVHQTQIIPITSDVRLIIKDINDNVPYFMCSPYYKTISELTPSGTTVFTMKGLAADADPEGGIAGYGLGMDSQGPFGVDGAASEGYIIVEGTLDYDKGPRVFAINITTTDIGDPPKSNWTFLYILLADGDDQNPVFDENAYYLSLPEENTSILNERIYTSPPLKAHDLDTGINAKVAYEIVGGHSHNGEIYFEMHGSTAELIPIRKLNRMAKSQFIITVKAYQVDSPSSRFSYATLVVTVTDSNIHKPLMVNTKYNVSLPENSPDEFQVAQVKAIDEDKGVNSQFSYYLIDPGGAFGINPETGSVYITDSTKLDREAQEVFIVRAYAQEFNTSELHRSEEALITIVLTDVNDNTPVFQPKYYEFLVNRSATIGHTIGAVRATDKDLAENADISYSLLFAENGGTSLFAVNESTGTIYVKSLLSSEVTKSFVITAAAQDNPTDSSQSRSSVAHVHVSVLSTNDNPPSFITDFQTANISENSPPGTSVSQIMAEDKDGDGQLQYTIKSGDPNQHFKLDLNSGLLTVKTELDRETEDVYNLTITVSDGKYEVSSLVTIYVDDYNDHSPVFNASQYKFSVLEEQGTGVVIGTVQALDNDIGDNAELEYGIVGNEAGQYFEIQSQTGLITTAKNLDREYMAQYKVTVTASDKGLPVRVTTATVTVSVVDINDNPPRFPSGNMYKVTVPERSTPGVILKIQATDMDSVENSETRYSLISGDTSLFSVNQTTGEVSTKAELNLEQTNHSTQYILETMAYNTKPHQHQAGTEQPQNDSTYVMVVVQDVNDNAPLFTMSTYTFQVYENLPVGDTFGRVIAIDGDTSLSFTKVHYWLDEAQTLGRFMIDEFTGDIRLMKPLNRDEPDNDEHITFTVYASDLLTSLPQQNVINSSSVVNITVLDINDNAPRFTKDVYTFSVKENTTVKTVISTDIHADDKDSGPNGDFIYDIVTVGSPVSLSNNGELILSSAVDYDEGTRQYRVMAIATDLGKPTQTGTAILVINVLNVNDNAPEFDQNQYTMNVTENQPVGTLLGYVSVTDRDRDRLQYTLQGDTEGFVISNSGELRTTMYLDHEQLSVRSLTVVVIEMTDSAGLPLENPHQVPATVTVHVLDQNDNSPLFSHASYNATIEEGSTEKQLLQVNATDDDSGVNSAVVYSVVSGNFNHLFTVNRTTGKVWITGGGGVDYSLRQGYSLVIQAEDGGSPPLRSYCTIEVKVIDGNNHAPVFQQTEYMSEIMENLPDNTYITQITADDIDTLDHLTYSLISDMENVTINATTGRIYSLGPLDRETMNSINVTASVSDGKHFTYTSVVIDILDENDNEPLFENDVYEKTISLDTPVDKSMLTILATDADSGQNGFVTQWLAGTEGKFQINPVTGEITTINRLDSSDKMFYQLVVYATDHGQKPHITSTTLLLYVNNSNHYTPEFQEFSFDVTIAEDSPVDYKILMLNVTDKDEGDAGKIDLTIVKGNEHALFKVNSNNELLVATELDFDTSQYHTLTIAAKDRASDTKSSLAVVRITLTDINDNPPVFVPIPDVIHTPGPVAPAYLLFHFSATDSDSSLNGNNKVQYTLLSHTDIFDVNTFIGELRSRTTIPVGEYTLNVKVSDMGSPILTSQTKILVKVLDSKTMDLYPQFEQSVYRVTFNESLVLVPTHLVNMNAQIGKGVADNGVYYNMSGGPGDQFFSINSATGDISVITPLDREKTASHNLIVSAHNLDNMAFTTQTMVFVTVEDANDSPPYFPFPQYDVTVREDAPVLHTVTQLQARDDDLRPQINYRILDLADTTDRFRLISHNNKATIVVEKELDRDTMSTDSEGIYVLLINVDDGPTMNNGIPAILRIKVLDVNDNSPVFAKSKYTASINEDAGPCKEIIQVTATDLDVVDRDNFIYQIQGDNEDMFEVDQSTGVVSRSCSLHKALDREKVDEYHINVTATDLANNTAETVLIISVDDVNDNPPHFSGVPYKAQTPEGTSSLGLRVYLLAMDVDLGESGKITFSVHERYADEFTITTTKDGDNYLGILAPTVYLDRERPGLELVNGSALYPVTVVARDHGEPSMSASTTVIIVVEDINDTPPIFERSEYKVSISEGTPLYTPIVTVRASDQDLLSNTNLSYSITQNAKFRIDEETGTVYVTSPLDIGHQQEYKLAVSVTDGVFSTSAILLVKLIDVNDNDPSFTQSVYYFSVAENDLSGNFGQFVGQVVAMDRDTGENGMVLYNITTRSARAFFVADPVNGNITVIGTLDRETKDSYNLIVTAVDKGSPPRMSTCEVEIEVQDINDNTPQFIKAPYTGEVEEHASPGTPVFVIEEEYPAVSATDRDDGINADVRYFLSGEGADLFTINQVSGMVTVATNASHLLDRETKENYNIQVLAIDMQGREEGLTGAASLTVKLSDINDQPPRFEKAQYQFSTNEVSVGGATVGVVRATDGDIPPNNRLQYTLISGAMGQFYLDRNTGEIYILGHLDRETRASYNLNVSVSDGGVSPGPLETFTTVEVTVTDYNDNPPVFQGLKDSVYHVPENEAVPYLFGSIFALDPDEGTNGQVTYQLENTTYEGPFVIEPFSGNLTTMTELDREEQDTYILNVIAKDRGSPQLSSTASLTVSVLDKNDHRPRFEQDEYRVNILEKSPVDSVILYAKAMDSDIGKNAEMTYSLHSNSGSETYFKINPVSGLVSIAKPIDKTWLLTNGMLSGSNDSYLNLTLTASDKGFPSLSGLASLVIKIDEINDDAPQFLNYTYYTHVPEEMPADTTVLTVEARVQDPNTVLTYSLTGTTQFYLKDSFSGEICTMVKLDRETQESHTFAVQVVDNRIPQRTAYATVTVAVLDVNDNTPVFDREVYHFDVEEGMFTQPYIVTKLIAKDLDSGDNGQVVFVLDGNSNTGSPKIRIGGATGLLSIEGTLDRETTDQYEITVIARDNGTRPLSSSTRVIIDVIDVNDNPPRFVSGPYNTSVFRGALPGTEVLEVYAVDPDKGLNAVVTYDIVTAKSPFYIQTKNGKGLVQLGSPLTPGQVDHYDIEIVASDLGTPRYNTTNMVRIEVIMRGEGYPSFASSLYRVNVPESAPVNFTILTLSAGSGTYLYFISGGNTEGLFSIGTASGVLKVENMLSMHTLSVYELIISAKDPAIPHLSASTTVLIALTENNDVPMFDQSEYSVSYPENQNSYPKLVIDLNTSDEMIGRPVFYYMIDNELDSVFHIENTTGKIWCVSLLDREHVSEYLIRVGCDRVAGTRRKREASPPNEALVTISVSDENDNEPRFPYSPLVYGVPATANFGYTIAKLQATDADSGNNSICYYTISGGTDANYFYIKKKTGTLHTAASLGDLEKTNFALEVTATDNLGQGHSVKVNVKVSLLTDNERVVLVAKIPPSQFEGRENELMRNLSAILGWKLQVEKIQPHSETKNGSPYVDVTITDMFFYAVDTSSGDLVPRRDVMDRIEERASEIEALFRTFEVSEVKSVVIENVTSGVSLSAAEAALIVIGILIVVGAIIGAICICVSWKKKEDERKRNEVNSMFTNGLKPYSLANPVFTDCDGYSEPIDLDKESMYEGCKPMEIQNLSMYIPDESETSSSPSMHAKFTTFGPRGNAVLIVDGSENTMVKTDGRQGGNSWASPYGGEAALPSRGTSQSSGYTSSDLELSSPCESARDDTRSNIPNGNPGSRATRGGTGGHNQSALRNNQYQEQQQAVHKSPKSEREAIEALQKLIQEPGNSGANPMGLRKMTGAQDDHYSLHAKYQKSLPPHVESRPDGCPPLAPVKQTRKRLFPPQIHPPPVASGLLISDQDPNDLPGAVQPLYEPTTSVMMLTKGRDRPRNANSPSSSPDSRAADEGDMEQLLFNGGSHTPEEDEDPTYAKVVFPTHVCIDRSSDNRGSKNSAESIYDVPKVHYAPVRKDLSSKHKQPVSQCTEHPLYRTVIDINTCDHMINSSVVKVRGRRGSKVSPLPSSADSSPTNSAGKRKALAIPQPPLPQIPVKGEAINGKRSHPGTWIPVGQEKSTKLKSVSFTTSGFDVGYTAL